MMNIDLPAVPDSGNSTLPTPSLPDNQPATPGGMLPTPSISGGQPAAPGEGPAGLPTPSLPSNPPVTGSGVTSCPVGYRLATVRNNQNFTDLLIENNVSYCSMRSANPALSTTRIAPGTRYCAPPAGSRKLCPNSSTTYVMSPDETLDTLAVSMGIQPGILLRQNPTLAPGDFIAGRVICIP